MKEDTKTSGKQQCEDQVKAFSELTEKVMKNYEQVFRTGLKLQEEAVKCCAGWTNPTEAAKEWQKGMDNVTKLTTGLLPSAQKRMEEALDLAEKNSRAG